MILKCWPDLSGVVDLFSLYHKSSVTDFGLDFNLRKWKPNCNSPLCNRKGAFRLFSVWLITNIPWCSFREVEHVVRQWFYDSRCLSPAGGVWNVFTNTFKGDNVHEGIWVMPAPSKRWVFLYRLSKGLQWGWLGHQTSSSGAARKRSCCSEMPWKHLTCAAGGVRCWRKVKFIGGTDKIWGGYIWLGANWV